MAGWSSTTSAKSWRVEATSYRRSGHGSRRRDGSPQHLDEPASTTARACRIADSRSSPKAQAVSGNSQTSTAEACTYAEPPSSQWPVQPALGPWRPPGAVETPRNDEPGERLISSRSGTTASQHERHDTVGCRGLRPDDTAQDCARRTLPAVRFLHLPS